MLLKKGKVIGKQTHKIIEFEINYNIKIIQNQLQCMIMKNQ